MEPQGHAKHSRIDFKPRPLGSGAVRLVLLILTTALGGCFNNDLAPETSSSTSSSTRTGSRSSGSASPSPSPSPSNLKTFRISNIQVAPASGGAGGGGAANSFTTTVFFDSSRNSPPDANISQVCSAAGSGSTRSCSCKFQWSQINTTSGSSVSIPRSVTTSITSVQPNLILCSAPSVYANDSELPEGSTVRLTIVPGPSNPDSALFSPPAATFVRRLAASQEGSFQDERGRALMNILRYSCYEEFTRGMSIFSKKETFGQAPWGEQASAVLSNQVCVARMSGGGGGNSCASLAVTDYSAQTYYYNFYIRDSARGEIVPEAHSGARGIVCPRVQEPIFSPPGSSPSTGFYPLDQQFALALSPSTTFTVGVESFTKIAPPGASVSGDLSCAAALAQARDTGGANGGGAAGGNQTSADGIGRVSGCLGFAMKPLSDGTCPSFKDSNGINRQTYRLRRYIGVYPKFYDSNGAPIQGVAPRSDQILVLDRPVSPPDGDARSPFTMRGPKPCPFAFFDRRGVTSAPTGNYREIPGKFKGRPDYLATNSSEWNGTNVDGIEVPNFDFEGDSSVNASCALTIPLYKETNLTMNVGLATVHRQNPALKALPIRPITAWAPHYEEDLTFEACAPPASPIIDPPLHFARDTSTGNIGWCAEAYPTQNLNLGDLDRRENSQTSFPGEVAPYTSHVVKNSISPSCEATNPISTIAQLGPFYPGNAGSGSTITSGDIAPHVGSATAACGTTPQSRARPANGGAAFHTLDYLVDEITRFSSATCITVGNACPAVAASTSCRFSAMQTCDRTVAPLINGSQGWGRFPLLARANQVEEAIRADSTFGCILTHDANGGKTGKASPGGGCCGPAVKLKTGQTSTSLELFNRAAHLEPGPSGTLCQQPTYN
jgi:hypothetical protein